MSALTIAVTNIKLLFFSFRESIYSKFNFAIWRPIGLKLKGSSEIFNFFSYKLVKPYDIVMRSI